MNQATLEFSDQQDVILQVLEANSFDVGAQLPGEAAVTFVTGNKGTAKWCSEWFVLQVPVAPEDYKLPSFDRAQNALHLNALAEQIRFLLPGQSCTLSMIAEFPLQEIADDDYELLYRRTAQACDAVNLALRSEFAITESATEALATETDNDTRSGPVADALVQEAGWSVVSAGENHCRVELEVRGTCQQASVEIGKTSMRLSTELLDDAPEVPALRQHAASIYLLTVPSRVRMVGAVVDLRERAFNPQLQVTLPVDADAALVGHALSALSVAFEASAEQVNALTGSDSLARRFLELQELQESDFS